MANPQKQKIITVKLGGSTMEDEKGIRQLAEDVVSLHEEGLRFIIVHGGGKEINRQMELIGAKPKKVSGLRITDDKTMEVVEKVLIEINKAICLIFKTVGAKTDSIIGSDGLFLCDRMPPVSKKDGESEKIIDLGRVGSVSRVNASILIESIRRGHIPIVAPFGKDRSGITLNVNADTAAGIIAGACSEEFILLTDVDGVYLPIDGGIELAKELRISDIHGLEEKGIIKEGMMPKTEACILALNSGVQIARIVNGMKEHALKSAYSDSFVGTKITR